MVTRKPLISTNKEYKICPYQLPWKVNILIDFSYYYNKAYFVSTTKTTKEEQEKCLFGYLYKTIEFFQKAIDTDKIYIVVDGDEIENKELFEDYKQNRTKDNDKVYANHNKALALISEFSKAVILKNKKKEADEVIGYLVLKLKEKKDTLTVIFSGDKDLLQLTSIHNVRVGTEIKNRKIHLLSDTEIFSKFCNSKKEDFTRVSTKKADIIKYRVFKGDTSDNIPPAIPRLRDIDIIKIVRAWKYDITDENEWLNLAIELDDLWFKVKEYKEQIIRNYKLMCLTYLPRYDNMKDGLKVLCKDKNDEKLLKVRSKIRELLNAKVECK